MGELPKITILAIETAIGGGSISVIRNNVELAFKCDEAGISRAEDLINSINGVIKAACIRRHEISMIAVSNGPGSYTGIRIGLATALGLADSLDCEIVYVDLLESLRFLSRGTPKTITGVPVGRDDVAWQDSSLVETGELGQYPSIGSVEEFINFLSTNSNVCAVLHERLYEIIEKDQISIDQSVNLINAGKNLARYVGLAANSNRGTSWPKPQYLLNPSRNRGLF